MLQNLSQLLKRAQRGGYAVPAFNCHDLEILRAVIQAAEARRSPVIIAATEKTIDYASLELIAPLFLAAARKARVPVAVHLDHGDNLRIVRRCLAAGFSSVMFDGSKKPFAENVRLTKQAVALAHKRGASCEGELGVLGGAEDAGKRKILFTDPQAAREFAQKTGVDALAVAIGTSHGAFKFGGVPKLDFKRLAEIRRLVRVPLVLHGASSVPPAVVRLANRYGAQIRNAQGVPDAQARKAVALGACKVNVDTDLRLAFTAAVREKLARNRKEFDPRNILSLARDMMQQVAEHEMRLLGSAGKA